MKLLTMKTPGFHYYATNARNATHASNARHARITKKNKERIAHSMHYLHCLLCFESMYVNFYILSAYACVFDIKATTSQM